MKQFTSHIDFSLTRKRFKMMFKHYSPTRSNSLKVLIAPVVLCLFLLFCTNQKTENGLVAYEFKGAVDGIMYKSDPVLYTVEEKSIHYLYPFSPLMLNENGEPFTGSRRLYNRVTNETGWEEIYNEGILTKTIYRNEEIMEMRNVSFITYQFENGRYVSSTVYDTTETMISRAEYTENSNRRYGPDDQLTYHGYTEIKDGNRWTHQKSWNLNGQLMSEISHDSSGQSSTWTFYNEDGSIDKQTRYEDGKIIETIE